MAKGKKTGGRQKGSPNKTTAELKAMILGALSEVGGQAYLVQQALDNPNAFMTLVGKVVPRDINAAVEAAASITVINEFE
jgi:hypothetical protein